MKMRKKGKVYPSPSSSSSSIPSCSANRDAMSVLKLLPTAILILASTLSLEDREVLAYMITRSIKSSNPSSIVDENNKNNNKKSNTHKSPMFDCGCFDCYTSYWFRWDSSPNRELIHQAIEAFEEHLTTGEQAKKNGKGKRRDKMGRRAVEKLVDSSSEIQSPEKEVDVPEISDGFSEFLPENEDSPVLPPEKAEETAWSKEENVEDDRKDLPEEEAAQPPATNHKGLVRKVLPDVLGILNSRLWSLWNPNV